MNPAHLPKKDFCWPDIRFGWAKIGTEFRIGELGLSSTEIALVALDEGGFLPLGKRALLIPASLESSRKFDDKGLPSSELISIGDGSFEQRFHSRATPERKYCRSLE